MANPSQTLANHAKYVPAYHFVAVPLLVLNLLWRVFYLYKIWAYPGRAVQANAVADIVLAVVLAILALQARLFALRVQDRVIRAEERERLSRLLPADWRPRVQEYSPSQLIALRFASDEELVPLAQKVLTDHITDRTTIKQMIRTWRADHLRA